MFGVIGISEPPSLLLGSSFSFFTGSSNKAGELSSYVFTLIPAEDLPVNVNYRIIMPSDYDLSYVNFAQCSALNTNGYLLSGNIGCKIHSKYKNIIDFIGNDKVVSKGVNITLNLKNVYNPKRKMK